MKDRVYRSRSIAGIVDIHGRITSTLASPWSRIYSASSLVKRMPLKVGSVRQWLIPTSVLTNTARRETSLPQSSSIYGATLDPGCSHNDTWICACFGVVSWIDLSQPGSGGTAYRCVCRIVRDHIDATDLNPCPGVVRLVTVDENMNPETIGLGALVGHHVRSRSCGSSHEPTSGGTAQQHFSGPNFRCALFDICLFMISIFPTIRRRRSLIGRQPVHRRKLCQQSMSRRNPLCPEVPPPFENCTSNQRRAYPTSTSFMKLRTSRAISAPFDRLPQPDADDHHRRFPGSWRCPTTDHPTFRPLDRDRLTPRINSIASASTVDKAAPSIVCLAVSSMPTATLVGCAMASEIAQWLIVFSVLKRSVCFRSQ